jgi:hypothetical protein
MRKRTEQEPVKLLLRLPPELHKALVESAEKAIPKNSLNREIVSRLHESFDASKRVTIDSEEAWVRAAMATWREGLLAKAKKVRVDPERVAAHYAALLAFEEREEMPQRMRGWRKISAQQSRGSHKKP